MVAKEFGFSKSLIIHPVKTEKITMIMREVGYSFLISIDFCACYLHMQMQALHRAVEILITTSCSTGANIFIEV